MSEKPDHFCPGCGAPQKSFPRYPWYFCKVCVGTATDGAGRALDVAGGMGFQWRYANEEEWFDCGAIHALIKGRRVVIHEARFGGVVAEPVRDVSDGVKTYGLVNLTGTERYTPPPPKRPRGRPFG